MDRSSLRALSIDSGMSPLQIVDDTFARQDRRPSTPQKMKLDENAAREESPSSSVKQQGSITAVGKKIVCWLETTSRLDRHSDE